MELHVWFCVCEVVVWASSRWAPLAGWRRLERVLVGDGGRKLERVADRVGHVERSLARTLVDVNRTHARPLASVGEHREKKLLDHRGEGHMVEPEWKASTTRDQTVN